MGCDHYRGLNVSCSDLISLFFLRRLFVVTDNVGMEMNIRILLLCTTMLWAGTGFAQATLDGRWSGSWYNVDRPGEGWVLQVLADGQAFVAWFTYPAVGEDQATQLWLAGNGEATSDSIRFDLLRFQGAGFGPGFDPDRVVAESWGELTLSFDSCDRGTATFSGPQEYGAGQWPISRLTELFGRECGTAPANSNSRSGAYFDPERAGEGWFVEELADSRFNVYWFTYDHSGAPMWLLGQADADGAGVSLDHLQRPVGTRFGMDFDPVAVELAAWGSLNIRFDGCDAGDFQYTAEETGYGSATISAVLLTNIEGLRCAEAPLFRGGHWETLETLSTISSGSFSAGLGDAVHVFGGTVAAPDNHGRYDGHGAVRTDLAPIPDTGRNLALATGFDGKIYVFGGTRAGHFPISGVKQTTAFAYDPARDAWDTLPAMPEGMSDGVALVHDGLIYLIAHNKPRGLVFNPMDGSYRSIAMPGDGVFGSIGGAVHGDEIWIVGGSRNLRIHTDRVMIYSPDSDAWRVGPPLLIPRADALVVSMHGHLFAVGGHQFDGVHDIGLGQVEVYRPELGRWSGAPVMPGTITYARGGVLGEHILALGAGRKADSIFNENIAKAYWFKPVFE